MGFSPSDMEFHRTKEAAARDVALAFGVPPMLLGLPGDNTYANYAEAHRAFYRLTVLPLVAKTLAAMSGWLPAVLRRGVPAEGRLRQRAGAGRGARGAVAADQRGGLPERRREAGAARAAEAPGGVMRGTGVRGGGSRFLYEPFDVASARIEVNERIQEERWQQLERRLHADRGGARPAGEADLARGLRRGVADPRRHRLRAPVHDRFLREGEMMHRMGGFGSLETKFCSFDGELALKEGAEIAGLREPVRRGRPGRRRGAEGRLRRVAGAARQGALRGEDALAARPGPADRGLGRGARGRARALRQGAAAARGAGGARGARAAAGGRDRRAVDRLPHAPEREGRGRPAAPARDRALGGVAGHLPDAPRGAGAGGRLATRRRTWRGPWRRASARPGRCWRDRAPARVAVIKESH